MHIHQEGDGKALGVRSVTSPALARSDDGERYGIAAAADDGQRCILKSVVKLGEADSWIALGELVSAPALACSPDGQTVHIAAIGLGDLAGERVLVLNVAHARLWSGVAPPPCD